MSRLSMMLPYLLVAFVLHQLVDPVSSRDCTVPRYPANGLLDLEPGRRVSPGTELTYSCQYSHYIDLTESPDYTDDTYDYYLYDLGLEDFDWKPTNYTRTCQASGEFDGLSVMECKLASCTQNNFDHGIISPNDTNTFLDGESVTLSCEEGYGPVGPTFKTCKAEKKGWNDASLTWCEKIYCPGVVLRHGYWEPNENQFYPGDQVSLHCDDGYELLGPHTMECTTHYGWNSTDIPVCLHKYTIPENGSCLDPGTSPGAILESDRDDLTYRRYSCEGGLHMVGQAEIWCNESTGHWSYRPPYCRTRHCFDTIPELAYRIEHCLQLLTSTDQDNEVNSAGSHRRKRAFKDVYGKKPLTLYLVIDQSGSIKQHDFDKATLFMKELINKVKIRELSKDGMNVVNAVRIGLIGFAAIGKIHFLPYQEDFDAEKMKQTIDKDIIHLDNSTNISDGLQKVMDAIDQGEKRTNIYWKRHLRESNRAVILITDGKYNAGGDPNEKAKILRTNTKYKYNIYVIGVAQTTENKDLEGLVDQVKKSEDIYYLKDYTSYQHLVEFMLGNTYNYTDCGISPVPPCDTATGHILGGNNTDTEDFPWSVNIYYKDQWDVDEIVYEGAPFTENPHRQGTLIGKQWVLTAAHNFYSPKADASRHKSQLNATLFFVEFGHGGERIRRKVKEIFDPGYTFNSVYKAGTNDIMLLKLYEDLPFSETIRPICLPEPVEAWGQKFASNLTEYPDLGHVAGTGEGAQLEVACLPLRNCTINRKIHRRIEHEKKDLFCAGAQGKDTEKGDSGSGYTMSFPGQKDPTDKRFVLVGVTSFNALPEGYEGEEKLGAYVNVSDYMGWIKDTILKKSV